MVVLYRDYNSYLRETCGCRVQKITLDAGLTCPNRDGLLGYGGCIYCNEKGSGTGAALTKLHASLPRPTRSSSGSTFSTRSPSDEAGGPHVRNVGISEQVRAGKEKLAKKYKARKFIGYFQSFSNTYAPLAELVELYGEALLDPDVVGLSIGTRPDCVPDEVLDHLEVLSRDRLIWMEYGLQSAHDKTLKRICRGHSVEAFCDAVHRTRARNIPVCVHVILGLPGEGMEEMLDSARFLARQDIQAVKIHLLYVIRGTGLHELYSSGGYSCLSREQYARAAGEFLALLPPHVIIQRLTGDPHPEELVAPLWALEKIQNLRAVREYMEARKIHQGKYYRP